MMKDHRKIVLARVYGRVQGVGFRMWTRTEAGQLGLAGWVRNEPDRSVTALISGPETAVATMVDRLWKGPRGAAVSRIDLEDAEDRDLPTEFRVVP